MPPACGSTHGLTSNNWASFNRETGKIAYRVLQRDDQREAAMRRDPRYHVGTHRQSYRRRARACKSSPTTRLPGSIGVDATRPAMDFKTLFSYRCRIAGMVRQAGGCRFGFDARHAFHVDVQLPWVE